MRATRTHSNRAATIARGATRFMVTALLLILLTGCAPPYAKDDSGQVQSSPGSPALPEITQELINERINDARVWDVLPESGTGDKITWSFDEDEPKEIVVVDKKVDGPTATIVLDIKTQSAPRSKNQRHLAGQIRTEWQLRTGWVLRRWEIVDTENISMKYRDLPKPEPSAPDTRDLSPRQSQER